MGCCLGGSGGSDELSEQLITDMSPLQFVNSEAARGPVAESTQQKDCRKLRGIISRPAGAVQCCEQNAGGYTSLHLAVEKNRNDIVQLLVRPAGDYVPDKELLEKRKRGGSTALHIAAVRGYDDICSTLLDAGANPLAEDDGGSTPLTFTVTDFDLSQDVTGVLRERKQRKDRIAAGLRQAELAWRSRH
eukprot:TRINITY_DN24207_c0_g1_i1.p1 TRINITY_DN24207_c0_g1~~TRINITY_DN24207_c0_g1_i1.p1  ORF type:complete len:205 (+),score=85.82 TRINITY_DN24207_c0_g1_i1:49-615(+)